MQSFCTDFRIISALSPHALLLTEAQTVCYHRDKLAICGLALDVRYGVAEELLQRFDVAAVPRDLDRVERGFRPFLGGASSGSSQAQRLSDSSLPVSRRNLICASIIAE